MRLIGNKFACECNSSDVFVNGYFSLYVNLRALFWILCRDSICECDIVLSVYVG